MTDRAGGEVAEATAEKPGIFISYARSDSSALAEELVAGLEVAGFRAFLDRHDIAATEDFEKRIGALILGADTVVFILSPAAVRSEHCRWEVDRAAELDKRLIPVQGAPVPEADVPERLRRPQRIFFDRQSFARPLSELAEALRQDVEWSRENTRLSVAATGWKAQADRDVEAANDLLLRGGELNRANEWRGRREANAPEIPRCLCRLLQQAKTERRPLQIRSGKDWPTVSALSRSANSPSRSASVPRLMLGGFSSAGPGSWRD
jgi:hypothetical protein